MPDSPLKPLPIIAAFDFDNTLINRDSLLPFLFYVHGFWPSVSRLIKLGPDFVKFMSKNISRQAIKEKILAAFFKGYSIEELRLLAAQYARERLDRYIQPEVMKRLRWHQEEGHQCLIISASVDLYLDEWAKQHKIDRVISSCLEIDLEGKVTGKLIGLNCWGAEKRRRLLEIYGPKENFILYAYGDSEGDEELLALANYPYFRYPNDL